MKAFVGLANKKVVKTRATAPRLAPNAGKEDPAHARLLDGATVCHKLFPSYLESVVSTGGPPSASRMAKSPAMRGKIVHRFSIRCSGIMAYFVLLVGSQGFTFLWGFTFRVVVQVGDAS